MPRLLPHLQEVTTASLRTEKAVIKMEVQEVVEEVDQEEEEGMDIKYRTVCALCLKHAVYVIL